MFLSNLLAAVVSLVVWVLGFFGFHVGGSLIHIVLLVAIISLALHFVRDDLDRQRSGRPFRSPSR